MKDLEREVSTRVDIEREARALAACDGKECWENISPWKQDAYRREARKIAEGVGEIC